jgi:hypothetical protein
MSVCICLFVRLRGSKQSKAGVDATWFDFNQKSQFGKILEGLRLENVDIFYGHSE